MTMATSLVANSSRILAPSLSEDPEAPPHMSALENIRTLPVYLVDTFSDCAFSGNPAAVCLVDTEAQQNLPDEVMQKVATELKHSETAFCLMLHQHDAFDCTNRFLLRWFTPTVEVPLCGHGTMATAAILFNGLNNYTGQITFDTVSGPIIARRQMDNICLDMPVFGTMKEDIGSYAEFIKLVVADLPVFTVRYSNESQKLVIRLCDSCNRQSLEEMHPDLTQMMTCVTVQKIRGVIVTLKGSDINGCMDKHGKMYDYVLRYFAPWNGIPEDPVTGSAQSVIAYYWSKKLNKKHMYVRQCSKRGGDMTVTVREDNRIDLAGKAVLMMEGKIRY